MTPNDVTTVSSQLPVDIVIPIYNAYEDLVSCVESVRRQTEPADYRLILIDDASTDSRIAAYLDQLVKSADESLLFLRNSENRGFSYTVNRGMLVSEERDVLLLNSDTLVTDGWLRKLRRCAESDRRIGTITPLSNNATICSFPKFGEINDLSKLPGIETINRAIEESAECRYPDIPSAIGFCMYICREAIQKVGTFDAETFGLGYGEDNDFSMRVAKAGYRNVLCEDTFVAHTGSRSFDEKRIALSRTNIQRLGRLHPDYADQVRSFVRSNPLAPILAVAADRLESLASSEKPGILHVLHGDPGGGTRAHVMDLVKVAPRRLRQYVLFASGTDWTLDVHTGEGHPSTYRFRRHDTESWGDVLGDLIEFLDIDLCHVHHLSGAHDSLLNAFQSIPTRYGLTLHDFFFACPTVSLLGRDGEFCGAPTDVRVCNRCLEAQTKYRKISIEQWRRTHAEFLRNAAFVIVPSQSVADIYGRYFAGLKVHRVAHGVDPNGLDGQGSRRGVVVAPPPAEGMHVVGVLGAISPTKGARRFERLVARTAERRLPLRWVLIGYTDQLGRHKLFRSPDGVLTVHGPYDRSQLGDLVDMYAIELFAFPAVGPESFSYALSEAWATGRPVVVPPIGALGERVSATGAGWVIDNWQDPDAILDHLVNILASDNREDFTRVQGRVRYVPKWSVNEMAAATMAIYLEHMPAGAGRHERPQRRAIARMHAAAELGRRPSIAQPPPPRAGREQLPHRNDACPCGTGKRYKHCCGAIGTDGPAVSAEQIVGEGLRRHRAGRLDEARNLYERALQIDTANGLAQHYLGMILWQSGDSEKAESLVRSSLVHLPQQADFYNNLGLCLSSMWRYDEAVAAYRRALEINSNYVQAHNNLGLGLQHLGEIDEALVCFKRALELAPGLAEARWNMDVALRLLEKP